MTLQGPDWLRPKGVGEGVEGLVGAAGLEGQGAGQEAVGGRAARHVVQNGGGRRRPVGAETGPGLELHRRSRHFGHRGGSGGEHAVGHSHGFVEVVADEGLVAGHQGLTLAGQTVLAQRPVILGNEEHGEERAEHVLLLVGE